MSQTQAGQEAALLVAEFADEDSAAVAALAPLVLGFYQDKARAAPRLRYWYAQRHLIDHLLKTKYPDAVDSLEGDNRYHLREKILSLENMRAAAQTEIDKIERQSRAARPGQIGQMTATATRQQDCPFAPDPNGVEYRGDPLRRSYNPR